MLGTDSQPLAGAKDLNRLIRQCVNVKLEGFEHESKPNGFFGDAQIVGKNPVHFAKKVRPDTLADLQAIRDVLAMLVDDFVHDAAFDDGRFLNQAMQASDYRRDQSR